MAMSKKGLDEEFPSLSKGTPARSASPPPSPSAAPSFPAPPANPLKAADVRSPENLFRTDLTPQDYTQALHSVIGLIPDPPYDAPDGAADDPAKLNMRLLHPDFFARFDLSTLFFIFFFRPGTSQQYFAIAELKKRDWIFHTERQTWFRRVGEPTERTAVYETARFEYFEAKAGDGWAVKQYPSFTFEFAKMV
jgi:CCR4-NOT transcription complex subunit 3